MITARGLLILEAMQYLDDTVNDILHTLELEEQSHTRWSIGAIAGALDQIGAPLWWTAFHQTSQRHRAVGNTLAYLAKRGEVQRLPNKSKVSSSSWQTL
jgi:hypothetical protein